jgi:hypothetical protein
MRGLDQILKWMGGVIHDKHSHNICYFQNLATDYVAEWKLQKGSVFAGN